MSRQEYFLFSKCVIGLPFSDLPNDLMMTSRFSSASCCNFHSLEPGAVVRKVLMFIVDLRRVRP